MPIPSRGALRTALGLLAVGTSAGLLSGMFGVGAGFVMVPLLMRVTGMGQRRAAATSLLAIAPAAIMGSIAYGTQGHVHVGAALILGGSGAIGSFLGARLLPRAPTAPLKWSFAGLLALVIIDTAVSTPDRGGALDLTWASVSALVGFGLVMGLAAGLFGLGGGVVAVPALMLGLGTSDLLARGTSLLAVLPTALAGSVTNARSGLVHVPHALIVGSAGAVATAIGSEWASVISPRMGNILLTIVLVYSLIQFLFSSARS